ncbi:hypothetical protein EDB92DRAFT_1816398 [Lactarius akahatsu]|uniref:Uncharacterized protein n=1 Tax=Lactarius akahatsu TaxID=416441 RepID=A0AAD4LGA7_9AGAM|nr:hypothetical protein EDB92DRAFT_1816398 [Lactarius akahatsu]
MSFPTRSHLPQACMVLRSAPPSSSRTSCPAPTFHSSHGAGPLVGEEFIRTSIIRYAINQVSEMRLFFHVRKDDLSFSIQLAVLDQQGCICQFGLRELGAVTGLPTAKPTIPRPLFRKVSTGTGNEVVGTAHLSRHSRNLVVAYSNVQFRPGRPPTFLQSSRPLNRLSPYTGAQLWPHSITGLHNLSLPIQLSVIDRGESTYNDYAGESELPDSGHHIPVNAMVLLQVGQRSLMLLCRVPVINEAACYGSRWGEGNDTDCSET